MPSSGVVGIEVGVWKALEDGDVRFDTIPVEAVGELSALEFGGPEVRVSGR